MPTLGALARPWAMLFNAFGVHSVIAVYSVLFNAFGVEKTNSRARLVRGKRVKDQGVRVLAKRNPR